jgi:hypothetical protein
MFKKLIKLGLITITTLGVGVMFSAVAFADDCESLDSYDKAKTWAEEKDLTKVSECQDKLSKKASAKKNNCAATTTGDAQTKCLEEAEKMESALKALKIAYGSKLVKKPFEKFIKEDLGLEEITEDLCMAGRETEIAAVIEEPIEFFEGEEITNDKDPRHNILNCVRNTLCVQRGNEGLQCVSYLRKNGLCLDTRAIKNGKIKDKNDSTKEYSASASCQEVQVFFAGDGGGTSLIFTYIGALYRWAASIVGIIAVLIVVVSGIQISAAAGDQQAVTNAKNRIFQSLGGLAILFLSGIILYTINPTFFIAG